MTSHARIERTSHVPAGVVEQVTELVRGAAFVDGFESLNEAALLALRHDDEHVVHFTASGEVLQGADARQGNRVLQGYAQLLESPLFSTGVLVVAPEYRRLGIGGALLDELLRSARHPLAIWAMSDTTAARRLAKTRGLVRARELLVMTRSMADPVPPPDLPPGAAIRTFAVGQDEAAWLAVNARAFAHHPEQGQLTPLDLEERMAEPWFDPSGFFLATAEEEIVGFHWTKQHPGRRGEVYVLGVDPGAGIPGLGTALLRTGLRHLAGRGNTEVLLYVEAEHERAVRLYQRTGFVVSSRDVMYAQPLPDPSPPALRFQPTRARPTDSDGPTTQEV